MKLGEPLVVGLLCATVLPIVAFRYLPLTDFPQHLAVASILEHLHDPAFGFDAHYEADFGRTLYVLPYLLVWGLGKVLPLELAQRLVVAIAVVSIPLSSWAIVRATGRPGWLALFTVPFAYNRAFFFGFHNFLLGLGLALAAYALLVGPRWSWRRALAAALLATLSALTHVYGLGILFSSVMLHFAVGDRDLAKKRGPVLVPAAALAVAWSLLTARARGYGVPKSPSLLERVVDLPDEILGGYSDPSEHVIVVAALAFFVWATLSIGRTRFRDAPPWRKVALLVVLANLLLYLLLPESTLTAKLIHFRHAVLLFVFLPLATPVDALTSDRRKAGRAQAALLALALFAIGNTVFHFRVFDREAREVEPVLAALPARPKVLSLVFQRNGRGIKSSPYVHFAAYAQARTGGLVAISFPRIFWNLPVRSREQAMGPAVPADFEWYPERYDDRRFGYFYDYVLVRGDGVGGLASDFPFDLVTRNGPWQLYRRRQTTTPTTQGPEGAAPR